MAETPGNKTEEKDEAQLLQEAQDTLNIVLGYQQEEEAKLWAERHTNPKAWEYYLASTHQAYEDVIKQHAETNPKIWELYQQQRQANPDRHELDKARAERQHPTTTDKGFLQMERREERLKKRLAEIQALETQIEEVKGRLSAAMNDKEY